MLGTRNKVWSLAIRAGPPRRLYCNISKIQGLPDIGASGLNEDHAQVLNLKAPNELFLDGQFSLKTNTF